MKFPLVPSTRAYSLANAAPDLPTGGALQRWNGWQKPRKTKPLMSKLPTKNLLPSRATSAFGGIRYYCSPSPARVRGRPLIPATNTGCCCRHLQPATSCYSLLARHVSSAPIPNTGYPFFQRPVRARSLADYEKFSSLSLNLKI